MAIGLKTRRTILWAFKILVGLLFLATGAAKLASVPMTVQEFNLIGLGQWFRYVTGAVEIVSAILLLIPATSGFGAVGLLGVSIGALFVQATILHGDLVHTLVLITASGFLLWKGFTGARLAGAQPA